MNTAEFIKSANALRHFARLLKGTQGKNLPRHPSGPGVVGQDLGAPGAHFKQTAGPTYRSSYLDYNPSRSGALGHQLTGGTLSSNMFRKTV